MPAVAVAKKTSTSTASAVAAPQSQQTGGPVSSAQGPSAAGSQLAQQTKGAGAAGGSSEQASAFGSSLAGLVPPEETQDQKTQEETVKANDLPELGGEKKPEESAAAKWKGSDHGLANYKATLGKWLGPKLYEAVAKELTLDKVAGAAESAWTGALKSAAGALGDAGDLDEAQVKAVSQALVKAFGGQASKWVKAHPGLTSALQGWVDASPIMVATIGLLAAAGAVAANVKLPELKKNFGITEGLNAKIAVNLGKVRDIALKEIKGELEYKSGGLKSAVYASWDDTDGAKAGLNLKWQKDDFYGGTLGLNSNVDWSEDKGTRFGAGASWKKDNLEIGAGVSTDFKGNTSANVGLKWRF